MKIYPYQLKDSDKERIESLNARNHYGLNVEMFHDLIKEHQAARNAGDDYEMALIEYRLTDINYHSECGLLERGLYNEALAIEW